MGGGPFNVRPNCPHLESHFGTPPRFWDPPPSQILGPPPQPYFEIWGVVLECVVPLNMEGVPLIGGGCFNWGRGSFNLTLPPSGVTFWDPPPPRFWDPPPSGFWDPPLEFWDHPPPLPNFGTPLPPPILRFRSCFGVRGPFKYGGGPFTVQIKDVSLGGGWGGLWGGGH